VNGTRERALLAILLIHAGEVADTDRLVTRKPGYVLSVQPEELDASRFARLVESAERVGAADTAGGLSLLAEALGLWCGPAATAPGRRAPGGGG
jgi:hypothetical protein